MKRIKKIQAMSAQELAEFIDNLTEIAPFCEKCTLQGDDGYCKHTENDCKQRIAEWLAEDIGEGEKG